MNHQFELAGGSVIGREHLRLGKNNQDAYSWRVTETGTIAVVCDGCGSSRYSEVGAQLGARLVITTLEQMLTPDLDLNDRVVWQGIQQQLLIQLQQVATQLGGDLQQTVQDYLLFTITGFAITSTLAAIFVLGDGVIAINGEVLQCGPFINNAPPYLAYGLLNHNTEQFFQLQAVKVLPTQSLQSLLIGSDGVSDLIQAATQTLPGQVEPIGDIAQFWLQDRYFRNCDQVRRQLALINRDRTIMCPSSQSCLRKPGLLPDDTTLIVLRRKLEPGCEWNNFNSTESL